MKKMLLFFIIFAVFFVSCKNVNLAEFEDLPNDTSVENIVTQEPVFTEPIGEVDIPEPIIPKEYEIIYEEYEKTIEAENGAENGNVHLSKERENYSGEGYMTGFSNSGKDSLTVTFDLPSSQHYNIKLVIASDNKKNNILMIKNEEICEFITSNTGEFEAIIIKNVFIEKGLQDFSIKTVTGGIDYDYICVESSEEIKNIKSNPKSTLINENANDKTLETMRYLLDNYGKNIISGQYVTTGTNDEINLIYSVTGKYPAMRLGDLALYTDNQIYDIDEVEKAVEWSENGGLVSYTWHWQAPLKEASYYSKETEFDLQKAVTELEIATLPIEDIQKLYDNGEISEECFLIVKDIDIISQKIEYLQENDVTVLWRPLHEASGGWFWWGASGFSSYEWLYDLLYERQTYYHKLNNLIWIWNAQDVDWYVGDEKCDIISADVYSVKSQQLSLLNTYIQYSEISQNKIIALSETASPSSTEISLRDKSMWSWFGVWHSEYVFAQDGTFSEQYTKKEDLIEIYNHPNTITLDKVNI